MEEMVRQMKLEEQRLLKIEAERRAREIEAQKLEAERKAKEEAD